MVAPRLQEVTAGELGTVVGLARDYYAYDGLAWDPVVQETAFAELLENPARGTVWTIVLPDGELAGYVVLAYGFSVEFGGRIAVVDELFLRETHRGQGLGRAVLDELARRCHRMGIGALRLEVEDHNTRARAAYEKAGFVAHARRLMTRTLGEPSP